MMKKSSHQNRVLVYFRVTRRSTTAITARRYPTIATAYTSGPRFCCSKPRLRFEVDMVRFRALTRLGKGMNQRLSQHIQQEKPSSTGITWQKLLLIEWGNNHCTYILLPRTATFSRKNVRHLMFSRRDPAFASFANRYTSYDGFIVCKSVGHK